MAYGEALKLQESAKAKGNSALKRKGYGPGAAAPR